VPRLLTNSMLLLNYDIVVELMLKIVNALSADHPHTKFDADHLESKSHDIKLLRPNRKEKWCVNVSCTPTQASPEASTARARQVCP
jgi:hypothetical protein